MNRNDAVSLIGLVMMGTGLWILSPAAALTVVGAVLLGIGVVGEWRKSG